MFLLILVFVLPYLLIYFPGFPRWVGRVVAVSILFGFLTVGIFWFSLGPRSEVIAAGAKLNRPGLVKWRNPVEKVLRGLGVVFGIFFVIYITVPFVADVVDIFKGGQPAAVIGTIEENTSLFGLSFLRQAIHLRSPAGMQKDSYSFFYSFSALQVGGEYRLTVLSRTMIVLDAEKLQERR